MIFVPTAVVFLSLSIEADEFLLFLLFNLVFDDVLETYHFW
jgi:hypothetical protein